MPENSPGNRAENVTNWYFRLNGFFSIPGFIVHPDQRQRYPRTEADLIGVRFPESTEKIDGRKMIDDNKLTQLAIVGNRMKILFILVEVKTDVCNMNSPWSNPNERNMQRVIRRLGFLQEPEIENVATSMYNHARWENDQYVLQYVCVGRQLNNNLQQQFNRLVQITWKDIAEFLYKRFKDFPEKLPNGPIHAQWPDFGREYAEWFFRRRPVVNERGLNESENAIWRYIKQGHCMMANQ